MNQLEWSVTGRVVHGDGRGRELGYPTANLDTSSGLPPAGVYAAWVCVGSAEVVDSTESGAVWHEATVSVGDNPTFGDVDATRAECFLHDFSGDLYGRCLEVKFVNYIREMATLSGRDELIACAADDVIKSRALLKQYPQAAG